MLERIINNRLFSITNGSGHLENWFFGLGALSLATFLLSLLFIPRLISGLSTDYFLQLSEGQKTHRRGEKLYLLKIVLSNTLGLFLIIAGLLMLFLPGQGLLTIFLGLILLNFPGKKKLLQRLIRNKRIQYSLNWLRKKYRKDPFHWPS